MFGGVGLVRRVQGVRSPNDWATARLGPGDWSGLPGRDLASGFLDSKLSGSSSDLGSSVV
jgi:hypothetical protein